MHEKKIAIMATGGMDSTVLMYQYQVYKPTILTVDYGQVAFTKQQDLLEYHIDKLNLPPLQIIKINFEPWQTTRGLFEEGYVPDEKDPLAGWDDIRYKEFFIEGRNMIMMAYAMAYCSAHKMDELLAGYLYGDDEWNKRRTMKMMTGDNSPQFVDMMNLLTGVGLSHQIRIRAPFYDERLNKHDVYSLGKCFGIDFKKTYSCYFYPPCGKCDNCLLRKEIMEDV